MLLKLIVKLTDLVLEAFAGYHAVDLTSACCVRTYTLASLIVDSGVMGESICGRSYKAPGVLKLF